MKRASVIIAGVFASFGYFGGQGQKWAFLVGMGLYALDVVLCLFSGIILSAAFQGWALFRMYHGLNAIESWVAIWKEFK